MKQEKRLITKDVLVFVGRHCEVYRRWNGTYYEVPVKRQKKEREQNPFYEKMGKE